MNRFNLLAEDAVPVVKKEVSQKAVKKSSDKKPKKAEEARNKGRKGRGNPRREKDRHVSGTGRRERSKHGKLSRDERQQRKPRNVDETAEKVESEEQEQHVQHEKPVVVDETPEEPQGISAAAFLKSLDEDEQLAVREVQTFDATVVDKSIEYGDDAIFFEPKKKGKKGKKAKKAKKQSDFGGLFRGSSKPVRGQEQRKQQKPAKAAKKLQVTDEAFPSL
ncbi:MAG: hypothetical protein MHM6MM_003553 [Cercozoa sp. M6MM]